MMKAGTMMISYQPLGELPNFFRSIISNQVCIEGMKFLVSVLHRIVKLGSRSKVHLKSLIRDLDLELVAIIARLHHPPTHPPENFSEQNNIEISSCMN